MCDLKVSVIVPVYNAEEYLRNAVESAVNLEEVGEVILIEDQSPDASLILCKVLASEYAKVKVLTHPKNRNRGAGPSRNLGIQIARFELISFLDADDWYLENRFKTDIQKFDDRSIDGVYNAVGYYIENEGVVNGKLTTIRQPLDPKDLLFYLMIGHYGHFHTNGITLRKSLFKKTGLFNDLRLHQDSHLWYRVAHFGKIIAGNIYEPVSLRRSHSNNRITYRNRDSKHQLMKAVYNDFINYENVDKRAMKLIIKKLIHSKSRNRFHKVINYLEWIINGSSSLK